MNIASFKELFLADASKSAVQYHRSPEGVLRVSVSGARIMTSEVTQDPIIGVQNTAFCRKKNLRKERTELEFSTFEGPPRRASVVAVWTL